MKSQQVKNSSHTHRQILRNESAALIKKNYNYQPSVQHPISFFIYGQSLGPAKQKILIKPTQREIKIKTILQQIKQKLLLLKREQQQLKQQFIQNSLIFKSNLQQIKSTQEFNLNSIQQYFSDQNRFFMEEISKLKLQIEIINLQVVTL